MAIAFSNLVTADGVLNGTTPVTLVSAPASNVVYHVRFINVYNRDSASVTGTLKLVDGASTRFIEQFTLTPGQNWRFGSDDEMLDLTTTSQSLSVVLAGSVSATEPDWVVCYAVFQ